MSQDTQTTALRISYLKKMMDAGDISQRRLAAVSGVNYVAIHRLLRSQRDTAGVLSTLEHTMNTIMQKRTSEYAQVLADEDLRTNSCRAQTFVFSMNKEIFAKVRQLRGTAEAK